jgi:hypothetical protein
MEIKNSNYKLQSIESISQPFEDCETQKIRKLIEKHKIVARIAYQIYIDLKLIKKWEHLSIHEHTVANICYLKGKENEDVGVAYLIFVFDPRLGSRTNHYSNQCTFHH